MKVRSWLFQLGLPRHSHPGITSPEVGQERGGEGGEKEKGGGREREKERVRERGRG